VLSLVLSVNGCKKSCKLSNLKVKLLKNVVDLSVGFAILLGVLLAIPISMIVIGKFTTYILVAMVLLLFITIPALVKL
jgi:hypothetical protein